MEGEAERDANNPNLIVDRMVSPFVAAAQETKLMSDLAEFRDSGLELAIVLDINFKCSVISRDWWTAAIEYEAEVELAGYPLSPTFVMGPAVYGRSKLRGRYEAGWADVERQVRDGLNLRLAAAKDFQANVARAYPVTKPASRPAGIDTSQAHTADQNSVQTRLQAVEDLRKRGLISEAEAEAKRQEILKSL